MPHDPEPLKPKHERWETFRAAFLKVWNKIRPFEEAEETSPEAVTRTRKLHEMLSNVNDSCAWITVLFPYVFYFLMILIATGILSHGLWHIQDAADISKYGITGADESVVWYFYASLIFIISLALEAIVVGIILYQYLWAYPHFLKEFDTYLNDNFVIINPKMERKFLRATLRRYLVYYQMRFAHHIQNYDFEDIRERPGQTEPPLVA